MKFRLGHLAACTLLLQLAQHVSSKEWCRAVPENGKPDFGVCLKGDSGVTYMVEVVPVSAPGISLQSDVGIILVGADGRQTKPIPVASEAIGTEREVFAERMDIGDPVNVVAILYGSHTNSWKCRKITVWKGPKYWQFDCIGTLDAKTPEATYDISGNKPYEAVVQTGNDEQAGTHGGVELTLIGKEMQASPKLLRQGFSPAMQKRIRFRAADVGELEKIVLKNTATDDPWYCDYVRINSDDGRSYDFKVKRWIGLPYDQEVEVTLKPSKDMELPAQDVECHTRASELISRIPEGLHTFKVRCPMGCQSSEIAHVDGSSIHPATSSICLAAIVDGVLSASGGEVVVTVVGALPDYWGTTVSSGVSSSDYTPGAGSHAASFFLYQSDSIDAISKDVRVVDAYGNISSIGRLEVRVKGEWGAVCKKGDFAEFSIDSARRACQDLGYLHGILLSDGCSFVNGQNVCAKKGYPAKVVIMCKGTEKSITECTYESAPDVCNDHINDVAVQCTNNPPDREPEAGTLRIVDASGTPAKDGIGRLEIYQGQWGTVCDDGWEPASERVACREMGYSGLKKGGRSKLSCENVMDVNYCGTDKEKILVVNVGCEGDEPSLRQCPHTTNNDIYCAHSEDIVVGCEGDGDPSGIGLFKKEEAPNVATRPFPPVVELACGDRVLSKPELKGKPGTMFVAKCPAGCADEPGAVKGTFVYTDDSPICKAAIHSGAAEERGGFVVVILGHSLKSFLGSERHGIPSETCGPYQRTFLVSRSVYSVQARTAPEAQKGVVVEYAGASTLISEGTAFKPRLLQLNHRATQRLSAAPRSSFGWSPPADFAGFNGHKGDFVDTVNLPGSSIASGNGGFTVAARVKVTGGSGTMRTILSLGGCDGAKVAVDEQDKLVVGQGCAAKFISTDFVPVEGEEFHVVVTYFPPDRGVAIFINGQRGVFQESEYDVNVKGSMVIGRCSESESEYFIGQISHVHFYDFVLSPQQIILVMEDRTNPMAGAPTPKGQQRTEDGRVCLSPCSHEEPLFSAAHRGSFPTNPAIILTCHDSLNMREFNGKTGQKFRVACPEDCSRDNGIVIGSKVYTPDSSICKAAIHGGAITREGGAAILTVHNGLKQYVGSRGSGGIISVSEEEPQLRSFSVARAPMISKLDCGDRGEFVLKLGIGEKWLVICPSGCAEVTDANVYGTSLYSPTSSVCRAAIHSGVLNDNGGEAEIQAGPEHKAFSGSQKNGVTSENSGSYIRSFTFVAGMSPKKSPSQEEL